MEDFLRKQIRKILIKEFVEDSNEKRYKIPITVPEDVKKINHDFKKAKYQCLLVGGAVRDAILKKQPKDFDLVTNAMPDAIIEILKDKDYVKNILETGKKFGVINVITKDGGEYEIATFRSDQSIGRHPDVKLNATIGSDAARRDLKINALYYDIDSQEVIDLVGGIEDLQKREVNTVGDANRRFEEDPLRIIRIIRFFCRFNTAKFNKETEEAIKNNIDLLSTISDERIRDEFYKGVFGSISIVRYLNLLKQFGFFKYIFGNKLTVDSNSFIEEKNPIILLACLLKHNNIKVIESELFNKKYSVDEINCIIFLISLLDLNEETASVIKKFYLQKIKNAKPKIGEKSFPITKEAIEKFANINNIDKVKVENLLKLANEFVQPSDILLSLGYKGEQLGTAISRLEKEFFKNPDKVKEIINSKDAEKIKNLIFIEK